MEKTKKLPKGAYGGISGKDYIPLITDVSQRGGNWTVLFIGVILAFIFAASTAYSGMKAGMTVAAGIPGSILGSALVAIFARQKGLLAKNLTQAMASGGESIASGIIFVLPAVILIGSQVNFLEGFLVGSAGIAFGMGVASIVYKYLIIEEHGSLIYPESMAIAETLISGESGGESLKHMGIGFAIGGGLTLLTESFFNIANNVIQYIGTSTYRWRFALEANPMLIGIGFIVGLPTAMNMFAGSFLSNFAIIPLIAYFTNLAADHASVWNNTSQALNQIEVATINGSYARYVGAGMMLSGGLIGAIRLIPTIIASIKETLQAKSSNDANSSKFSILILFIGIFLGFITGFAISGTFLMAIVGAVLSLFLAMLFVIVAGRLTGVVGTSNLPVSGMTIASLVIMTLVFVSMGWTSTADNKTILLFGTFIVIAVSAAGGYAQSQKVTYLIGGNKGETDKFFFIAGIVGVATVVGIIMLLTNQLAIIGDNPPFALPQANMMKTLTSGIMQGDLPWTLILSGMAIAIFFFFLKLPIMSIAVGFYLPIATSAAVLVGAIIRVIIEKTATNEADKEAKISNGIGISSGLIAGASIIGLVGIILHVFGVIPKIEPIGFAAGNGMGIIFTIILVTSMLVLLIRRKK